MDGVTLASCLGNCLPFLGGAPSFIHHHDDPSDDDGGFQVMFTYDPENAPQIVPVSLMSNCDSLQPISKPLQLSELPYEFQTDDLNGTTGTIFHFVNLGDKKVCLILYKFFYPRAIHGQFYWSNTEEMRYI